MGRASNRKKLRRENRKKIAAMATTVVRKKAKQKWFSKGLNEWPQGERERSRRLRRIQGAL